MNRLSKLFAGFAAIALFAACSNDDIIDEQGAQPVNPIPPVGGTAYMKINIADVNSVPGGRSVSTDPTDPDSFQDGNFDEHKVANAKFFFFDENGIFVQEGSVQDPNFGEDDPADVNVEYIGKNNILVLEDLTEKGWPKYLITVLNAPDFVPESTIKATAEKLDNYYHSLEVYDKDGNNKAESNCMVMSTSSYFNADKNHNDAYPYATLLDESNFKLTPEEAVANANAVKIYVERLAAKVELSVGAESSLTIDGRNLYKLTQTVAGDPNNEGGSTAATTDLYLEVLGWDLSGTATRSHMSKQLKSDWNNNAPFAAWNDAPHFRSYWAKSALYNDNSYGDANKMPDVTDSNDENELGLVYTTFGKDPVASSNAIGAYDYCNELTSSAANIFTKDSENRSRVVSSQTTHVVLKTRICDKNGEAIDMVSYHGVLYLESAYINYVLNKIKNGDSKNLNFYTFTGTDENDKSHYKQVDSNFFKLEKDASGKTGHVHIVIKDKTVKLYADNGSAMAEANVADLETKLNDNQPAADSNYPAVSYKGGANVYYIPIEHYAAVDANADKAVEGYYGVVRNHWYKLNISSFSKVGHGVFDPDEKLFQDEAEDPLYYLGVNINILSWKIVNQDVPL